MENNKKPITGECACGKITYKIQGKLHNTTSCHCSNCRKIFNAQASAVGEVKPNEFKWLSGENLLTSYVNKEGWGVQFCKICGSTLCTIHNGNIYQVTLGCVNGNIDITIDKHIHVESKAKWEILPKNVTQLPKNPPSKKQIIEK